MKDHRNEDSIGTAPAPLAGFTLVELMVVLVVLAIVSAVVVPHAIQASDMEALSAARVLSADLQYAQDMAITTQQDVTVTFNVAASSYTLSNASGPLIHPINKTDYVTAFATQRGFGEVRIQSASFGSDAFVTFDEVGSPSAGGSVQLQAGAYTCQVDVAATTGKVTVSTSGS